MSANNWRECPQCLKLALAEQAKKMHRAVGAYGKIPAAEYESLLNEAREIADLGETLREDYELMVSTDGEFRVGYSCRCDQCGFKWRYHHKEQALTGAVPAKE